VAAEAGVAVGLGVVVFPSPARMATHDGGTRKGEISMERAAANALHRGDFRAAADLYEQLAVEQPEHPTFRRAARILRERQPAQQAP
jgi:hypothetical protein